MVFWPVGLRLHRMAVVGVVVGVLGASLGRVGLGRVGWGRRVAWRCVLEGRLGVEVRLGGPGLA